MTPPGPPQRRDEAPAAYSARRAIALWLGLSLLLWIVIAIVAARFAGQAPSLDADTDRLSKIKPAAGGAPNGAPSPSTPAP